MKQLIIPSIVVASLALSPAVFAKKNLPNDDPLAILDNTSCEMFEGDFIGYWDWTLENGEHTKFGGDLDFTLSVTFAATLTDTEYVEDPLDPVVVGETTETHHLGFGLGVFDDDSYFTYNSDALDCIGDEGTGSCMATLSGYDAVFEDMLKAHLEAYLLGMYPGYETVTWDDFDFAQTAYKFDVKAMKPGKGNKRQNYYKTVVCEWMEELDP